MNFDILSVNIQDDNLIRLFIDTFLRNVSLENEKKNNKLREKICSIVKIV
jgi:hypothetical protein